MLVVMKAMLCGWRSGRRIVGIGILVGRRRCVLVGIGMEVRGGRKDGGLRRERGCGCGRGLG